MTSLNFALPSDLPSVYYLSNQNNISLARQPLLQATLNGEKLTAVSKLLDYLKEQPESPDNYLFAIHLLDQLIRLDKKETPPFIRYASALGELPTSDQKTVRPYLEQVKQALSSSKLSKASIEAEQIIRALTQKDTDAEAATKNLKDVWPILEAQQLGIRLKMREVPISEEEAKLLKVAKPALIVPDFLGDETLFSSKYFLKPQQFSGEKRGIIYQLFQRHFNGAFHSLKQILAQLDTTATNEDLLFLIAIAEQLASICELPSTGFVTATLNKQESLDKWKTDIKLYFETVHHFLLRKAVPNLHDQAHAKAEDLANKLQKKQDANWTPDERQSTYYRAKAWVYSKNQYYQSTYQAAVAAEVLSELGAKDIASYKRKYKKFVHAEELGRRLATYHQKHDRDVNQNKLQYAFQMSVLPNFHRSTSPTLLHQLGIDLTKLNDAIGDESKYHQGEVDITGPETVLFTEANESFINLVAKALDKQVVKKIILQNCQISYDLPTEIFYFKALRQLHVIGGGLSHISEKLGQLAQLDYLYLSGLKELSSLPSAIGNLSQLTHLRLQLTSLVTFPSISNCQKLKRLAILNSQVKTFPESICQIPTLEHLSLSNNQFTEIPTGIQNLQKLQSLKLAGNPWAMLPKMILALPNLKEFELREEDLVSAQMEDELKAAFLAKATASREKRSAQDEFYRRIGK